MYVPFLCSGITLANSISFVTIPSVINWLNMILKGCLIKKIFFFFTNSLLRPSI